MVPSHVERQIVEWKNQCDWFSLRFVEEVQRHYAMRDARPDGHSTHRDRGVMIEVVMGGRLAYGATSDLSPSGLEQCFLNTRNLALQLKEMNLTHFDPAQRGRERRVVHSQKGRTLSELDSSSILAYQNRVGQQLKEGANVLTSSMNVNLITTRTVYLTSDGAALDQTTEIVGRDMRLTGRKNQTVQSRSDHGYMAMSHQVGAEVFDDLEGAKQTAERLITQVNELLDAPDCPSDERDVLIAPDQMMLQIHESIGHPLELDRILGDERNYAGWSFVKPSDFGQLQYGSPLMNVSFDPHLQGEIASYDYDDAGVRAEKVYLIKEGKLIAGLGGLESQGRLGLPGVANFRAQSWNRPPIDRMANLNLEPGQSSFDEMVRSVERGVYFETNRSWSIDDYRNKFQFGCEYARLIEDGELKGVVKNPNYRGTTVAFWNALQQVGDASTFEVYGTPHCGKGEPNQVIRVGHASPACLFKNLTVFGGA